MEWSVCFFFARDLIKGSEQSLDAGEKIELMEVTFARVY